MSTEQAKRYGRIKGYHEGTKHHPHRYARSPDSLDWDNQPYPFRCFEGAPQIPLPLIHQDQGLPYTALYDSVDGSAE